jgi:hypothetical protein
MTELWLRSARSDRVIAGGHRGGWPVLSKQIKRVPCASRVLCGRAGLFEAGRDRDPYGLCISRVRPSQRKLAWLSNLVSMPSGLKRYQKLVTSISLRSIAIAARRCWEAEWRAAERLQREK